jgi:hypothetical protein
MNAPILNNAIRLIGYEVIKRGRIPYNNELIEEQLALVEEQLSPDHRNELIKMFRLDEPNVDGALWA